MQAKDNLIVKNQIECGAPIFSIKFFQKIFIEFDSWVEKGNETIFERKFSWNVFLGVQLRPHKAAKVITKRVNNIHG